MSSSLAALHARGPLPRGVRAAVRSVARARIDAPTCFARDRFPPRSKVGRVAIVKSLRGTGGGRILCEALEEHVRERRGKAADVTRGKSSLELLAYSQKTAEGFYAKMGWHSIGPDFIEVCPHPSIHL